MAGGTQTKVMLFVDTKKKPIPERERAFPWFGPCTNYADLHCTLQPLDLVGLPASNHTMRGTRRAVTNRHD